MNITWTKNGAPFSGVNGRVTMRGESVTPTITWTKNGAPFSGVNGRVTMRGESVTPTIFYNQLQFSPLSSSMDNGTYVCMVTLTPVQQQFVIGATGTGSMDLNVVGKNCLYICVRYNIQYTVVCQQLRNPLQYRIYIYTCTYY